MSTKEHPSRLLGRFDLTASEVRDLREYLSGLATRLDVPLEKAANRAGRLNDSLAAVFCQAHGVPIAPAEPVAPTTIPRESPSRKTAPPPDEDRARYVEMSHSLDPVLSASARRVLEGGRLR